MTMQKEVYTNVLAEVNPEFIPDNFDNLVKFIEKDFGVSIQITYREGSPVYHFSGSLQSIQTAESRLRKTRQEGLDKTSSEPYKCKEVSGCGRESTGGKIVDSKAARLSLSGFQKEKNPETDTQLIVSDADNSSSVLDKQSTIDSDRIRGSGVGEDEEVSKSSAAFRYSSYGEPSLTNPRVRGPPDFSRESTNLLTEKHNESTLSFKTPLKRHKVSVYNGDLTKVKVDAVVCATNSYLAPGGGVSKAIAEAGGYKVKEDARQYVDKNGPLSTSGVIHTRGGRLPSKYVIHAVGPEWKKYKSEKNCLKTLKETFLNCFRYAEKDLEVTQIALPLISSGLFGVPIEMCSNSLFEALMEFDREACRKLDIHIVDIKVESVKLLQSLFGGFLKSYSIPFDKKEIDPSPFRSATIQRSDVSSGASSDYALSSPNLSRYNRAMLTFKTPSKHHKVSVYSGDLTKIKADAIVNAANSYLAHIGGVAKAIAEVGGYQVKEESDNYIKRNGPLYPSEVTYTRGGNLPSRYVIHAVGPVWKEYKNKRECVNTLKETFINCFRYAEKDLYLTHIALPLISSGIFGVPTDKCVKALYDALMEFDQQLSRQLDIHIVDTSSEYLQTLLCEHLRLNSVPFEKKESETSPPRSTVYSSDVTDCARNGYAQSYYADSSRSISKKHTPVVKDFQVEGVKKTNFSFRKGDSAPTISLLNTTSDTARRQYKETSHDSNSGIRNHEKAGPMKAVLSNQEALVKAKLEEFERKGCPPNEFREMQYFLDKVYPIVLKKGKLFKNQDKPSSQRADSMGSPSSERQSRRDSKNIVNKEGSSSRRSQSLDSRRPLDRSEKVTAKDLNKNLDMTSKQESGFARDSSRHQRSDSSKSKNKGGSSYRSQSVDRRGESDRINTTDFDRRLYKNFEQETGYTGNNFRQPRSDSRNNGGSSHRRSQSLDRHHQQDRNEKVNTRNFERNLNINSEQEASFPTSSVRQSRSDSSKNKKRESWSLDIVHQKNVGEIVEKTDTGRDVAVTSQHKSYITKCCQCNGREKLTQRKDCEHMICQKCRSMGYKRNCRFCERYKTANGVLNGSKTTKGVSPSAEDKRDIKLAPKFESPIDSINVLKDTDARRRRREKQSLNQTPRTESPSPREYAGASTFDEIRRQSPSKEDNYKDIFTQPRQVAGDCPICMGDFEDPVALHKCDHIFCRKCIQHAFEIKLACPICGYLYGSLVGDQPDGTMEVRTKSLTQSLPGYPNVGIISITYDIPSGIQNELHPNPGAEYKGTLRRAYLPDNDEGQDICRLLKKAFDAKLTFTVGRSVTTGQNDTVTWNDIHHKTRTTGGPSQFGYPDDSYLQRVREELAAKGIR
ncbi:uncharacterized protein LOC117102616 [Anneissia japonica]|uniref:uncharacterized protein LOC117102616 n=1 Tax=Anneissia japonica TaxID=1529436 RepID=UPI001425AC44|nr:uncharacterized protein LOC117102616 [Anneissia japonica]XP_033098883.1 uncharacterized protein LOC117102616 [Anneissia japonica]XP_033098884.1 uncharacterized protein LOC117102616 [Anneissia japonica]XP_033098885.1 uncharacterized protein LOC117102616 [Anneissia japonica]